MPDRLEKTPIRRSIDDHGSVFVHAPATAELSPGLTRALDEFRSAVAELHHDAPAVTD